MDVKPLYTTADHPGPGVGRRPIGRWLAGLMRLGRRDAHDDVAHRLYRQAVEQARQPVFYRDLAVPDTVDGRFDLIVLHVILVLRRLEAAGQGTGALRRRLQEVLFDDMDRALREMGVGDLSVGKHVKNMAGAFFGRLDAYGQALDAAAGDAALADAVRRNIYRGAAPSDQVVDRLAAYVEAAAARLAAVGSDALAQGRIDFGPVGPEA